MNNLTDIATENQRQWKSINALAAAQFTTNYAMDKARFNLPDAT